MRARGSRVDISALPTCKSGTFSVVWVGDVGKEPAGIDVSRWCPISIVINWYILLVRYRAIPQPTPGGIARLGRNSAPAGEGTRWGGDKRAHAPKRPVYAGRRKDLPPRDCGARGPTGGRDSRNGRVGEQIRATAIGTERKRARAQARMGGNKAPPSACPRGVASGGNVGGTRRSGVAAWIAPIGSDGALAPLRSAREGREGKCEGVGGMRG